MGERGLVPVEDASRLFLVRREGEMPPGVAAAAVLEGSRSLLVEIQALTVSAKSGMSRVYSDRIDSGRVSRVAAALEKHLGIRLSDQDIYVNVAGGIRIAEVGVELALGCAVYSARTGLALPADLAIAGELSLTGEIRPLRRMAGRLRAARALGFSQFLGPAGSEGGPGAPETAEGGSFIPAADIRAAIRCLFKGRAAGRNQEVPLKGGIR
jgi:DNA repair protein RadA/Sms